MMWVHICIPLNMHVAVEARTGFVVLDLGFGDEGGLCARRPFEECYGNGAAGQCAGLAGSRGDTGIVELVPCLLFYSGTERLKPNSSLFRSRIGGFGGNYWLDLTARFALGWTKSTTRPLPEDYSRIT